MNTVEKLVEVMVAPHQTMADNYIRMTEIIDYVESYFLFNVDDVVGKDIGGLSLNQLKKVLEPKIEFYKQFVATDRVGVFAKAETIE
ncbi:MAG: hypothetical protein B7X47_04180 [Ferrovum sp. 34-44-207]|nr:MAG: hypothetical protein B7Z65_03255 [Ferrovum sp. 21-44-67]OZB33550.1 MAG: hypothetical protein B7X47_04180 [Ferrovum sp. 34-44-207]